MASARSSPEIDLISRIPAVASILDVVCRTTGMGFAAVARVTEDRWIAFSVRDQIGFGLQAGGELDLSTTICCEVAQHRAPIVISNVAEDATYSRHQTPLIYGFQSYISVPITLPDGAFFGTLCAIDPLPRPIDTPEILGSFTLFAELIAFHIDANIRLESAHAFLLRERELSELREQFIAVLGHDLRNPLASVAAGARLLRRYPERAAEVSRHMEQSVSRMSVLIDDVLDFARGRLGGGFVVNRDTATHVEPLLGHVVQELQATYPDRVITVEFALEQPVTCDGARIAQLLSNLLGNALTHGSSSQPVTVRARSDGEVFELSVANSGDPIPPDALERLFQPFFRHAGRSNRDGLGLGLFIASEIARAHGGRIDVSSTPSETCFTFRMPLAGEH